MKALIAMSGGVDSSVTAYLMKKKGYDCIGVTFKMFDKTNPVFGFHGMDSDKDINDARDVCNKVDIPFMSVDVSDDFYKYVINNFIKTYENGGTPNPCIQCNRFIKFRILSELADKYDCDVIATGHYGETGFNETTGRYFVKKAADLSKDQSYVLYSLTQEQIKRTIFPLSELTKDEARAIAEENGFLNAHKNDSQDICFVHDGDYARFISEITGKQFPQGKFVDLNGNVLGSHKGIIRYTIGQRRGLELPFGERIYVKAKNIENNTVVLSDNNNLFEKEITADNFNFVAADNFNNSVRCKAKIRYKHIEQPATVSQIDKKTVKILFDEPQRAPAKGQSVVLYDDDIVLGGGLIK